MIITEAFLSEQRACTGGMKWFREGQGDNDHALIVRLMAHEQNVRYAIYAAEQVIHLYAAKYPNDDKPQKAIQAAKDYLLDGKITAYAAADAVYAAAYAAAYAAYAADEAYAADAADRKEMKTKILRYGPAFFTGSAKA